MVEKMLSRVNYRVRESEGKQRSKTVHVNSTKCFVEREETCLRDEKVCALTVLANDEGLDDGSVKLVGACKNEDEERIANILQGFSEVFEESDVVTMVEKQP